MEERRPPGEELSVAKCIKRRTGQGLDDLAKKELAWHGLASRLAQVLMQQRVNNCGNTQREREMHNGDMAASREQDTRHRPNETN